MIKAVSAVALSTVLAFTGAAAESCKIGGPVEGNVIDRRVTNGGLHQVQVADTLEQDQSNAPWETIDAADWEACNVGAQYPQCIQEN